MKKRSIYLGVITAALAVGCGGDDDGEEQAGSAPVIEALSFEPQQVTVGEQAALSGTFTFSDADSDANRFAAALTLPSGARQSVPPSPTQGTAGRTEGEVLFLIAIAPPEEGAYTLELWMIDQADNESNHLDGTVQAEPSM